MSHTTHLLPGDLCWIDVVGSEATWVRSGNFARNLAHLRLGKGTQGLRGHKFPRTQGEHGCRCRLIVRGIENEDAIIPTQAPELFLDLDPMLFRVGPQFGSPLTSVLDLLDPALRELQKRHVGSHRSSLHC